MMTRYITIIIYNLKFFYFIKPFQSIQHKPHKNHKDIFNNLYRERNPEA